VVSTPLRLLPSRLRYSLDCLWGAKVCTGLWVRGRFAPRGLKLIFWGYLRLLAFFSRNPR
jgi:hypothetical protein